MFRLNDVSKIMIESAPVEIRLLQYVLVKVIHGRTVPFLVLKLVFMFNATTVWGS